MKSVSSLLYGCVRAHRGRARTHRGRAQTSIVVACLTAILLSLAIPNRASAQLVEAGLPPHSLHFCGTHSDTPTARAALRAFQTARKAGTLNLASKSASPPDVGDRQTFRIYSYAANGWRNREFELRDKTVLYHAWVDVANLAAVTAAELATIKRNMLTETPAESINPAKGVMANNNDVFGLPPNVDGDGIVDFLFYDIDNQNVGGFVSAADLNTDLGGNGKDVLHLDIFQSISFMPRLIAHEYTHLIHFNYDFDVETFVSEGLAEFAMVVNGYNRDTFPYLGFPSEHNKPLFSWRGVDSPRGGWDYDRGRLFFSYMAERVGPLRTGEMVRMVNKGAVGMDSLLVQEGLTLSQVIADFHTANWVTDRFLDPAFGYTRPFSAPLSVLPATQYQTNFESGFTPELFESERPTVEAGAVNYVRWTDLANLSIDFDGFVSAAVAQAFPEILDDMRSRLRGRIVATRDDGRVIWKDIRANSRSYLLEGNYTEVRLIVTGSDATKSVSYMADGAWRAFGTGTATESGDLPEVFSLTSVYPNPLSAQGTVALELGRPSAVRIFLIDPLGRRVGSTTESFLPPGQHEVPVDVSSLVSGSYLMVIESGPHRRTIPVVVLR